MVKLYRKKRTLVEAGADFLAVVAGVWDYREGPAAAVRAFNRIMRGEAVWDRAPFGAGLAAEQERRRDHQGERRDDDEGHDVSKHPQRQACQPVRKGVLEHHVRDHS